MQCRQGDIEQLCTEIKASLKLLEDKLCKQDQFGREGRPSLVRSQLADTDVGGKHENAVLTETPTDHGKKIVNVDENDANDDTIIK